MLGQIQDTPPCKFNYESIKGTKKMQETLVLNLLSPLTLAFVLGILARLIRSDLSLPKELYQSISIYLLFALGLKGGVELAQTPFANILMPAFATILLGFVTPFIAYAFARYVGKFSIANSAGLAAHYGSVSAVTFIAAQQFAGAAGYSIEGYLPTLLAILEAPGIFVGLAIGVLQISKKQNLDDNPDIEKPDSNLVVMREILTSRSMVLLLGGLIIGTLTGPEGFKPVQPFFETGFKGALCLFLLEMGLVAGSRLADLKRVGTFLIVLGITVPIINGSIGVLLGHWAGLSLGGAAVLGTMASSASYIAAPPAVRLALPDANPTYYLTASLAITFPFNLIIGIPIYFQVAEFLGSI